MAIQRTISVGDAIKWSQRRVRSDGCAWSAHQIDRTFIA